MIRVLIPLLAMGFWSPQVLAQSALLRPSETRPGAVEGLSADAFDAAPDTPLTLTFPDGETHEFLFDRGAPDGTPARLWVGRLAGSDSPYRVIITEGAGVVFGYAATPTGAWRLAPGAGGGPSVWQRETGVIDEPGTDALAPPRAMTGLPRIEIDRARLAQAAASNGTIDIAIVYTDGLVSLYQLGLMVRLQHLVNVLDQALIDSDAGLRARLVGATRVPGVWNEYTSTLETIDDLFAGASFGHPGSEPDVTGGNCSNGAGGCINDGDLSSLLAWRNALGADIVVMLRRYWRAQQTYCGVAYVPGFGAEGRIDPAEDWILGVAVSGDGPDGNGTPANCGDLTFSHEVGHNLGSTHNVENTSGPGVFTFSYGHRMDCSIRTIMGYDSSRSGVTCSGSYPNETWLARFSNPAQFNCGGLACGAGGGAQAPGSPTDDTNTPTDNARSIRDAGFQVRDYRPAGLTVRSALLPYSRTVASGTAATAFVTIANPASTGSTAIDCGLELHGASPGQFTARPTDPATNTPNGGVGERVDIPAGEFRTFVISLRRGGSETHGDLRIDTVCANRAPSPSIAGVNTFRYTTTTLSLPDVVALAATNSNNGIVELPAGGGASAFSVASINLRSRASIVVSPQAASGLPALGLLEICRTNAQTGACDTPRAATQTVLLDVNETATFAVFVRSNGEIANDPAAHRVFVHFRTPSGQSAGATSVAVRTAAGP